MEMFNVDSKSIFYFFGHIGVGKTTCASIFSRMFIMKGYNIFKLSFASMLKKMCYKYFGVYKLMKSNINKNKMDKNDFSNRLYKSVEDLDLYLTKLKINGDIHNINNIDDIYKYNPIQKLKNIYIIPRDKISKLYEYYINDDWRSFLQYYGTDIIREEVNENLWVSIVKYNILNNIEYVNYFLIDDVRFINEKEMLNSFEKYNISIIPIYIKVDKEIVTKRINMDLDKYNEKLKHIGEQEHLKFEKFNIIENNFSSIKELENYIGRISILKNSRGG